MVVIHHLKIQSFDLMPEKPRTRALSASRQRRQTKRRSSLDTTPIAFNSHLSSSKNTILLSGIDLRTTKQKIEDLENEVIESTPEAKLNHLLLMQVYTNLEYGDISIENARTYINLSKFYYNRKTSFLPQAKFHALNAQQILEQLNLKSSNDNLTENVLAYDIYLILIKCSLNAQQYFFRRDIKTKNKHILAIDKTHIDHDMKKLKKYLEKLQDSMNQEDYDQMYMEYLVVKLEIILINLKEFNHSIYKLIDEIVEYTEKYFRNEQIKRKIDLYLRSGLYLIHFNDNIQDGMKYYKSAVELADEQEKTKPSIEHKQQLANTILQRTMAKVKTDRLTDDMEKEFQRAIGLYKQTTGEVNKNVLKVIDELATFYTKMEKYQDALNILCESLPDKIRLFGDFSEEVIQTESRIGAIYLREGECLNAAEHLQTCLDLQEFVYGPNDSRTCETRKSVGLLKKDPMVSRTFFAQTQDGKRQDRPAFRVSNRVSHEKTDLQLLQTVTKKPPLSSKT